MNMKKYSSINKIIVCVIVFCMIIFMQKVVLGEKSIELTENDEVYGIISEIFAWQQDNPFATESQLADAIKDACDGDIQKMEKLQRTYTYKDMPLWNGSNRNSEHYIAVDIAIEANKNNTQIEAGDNDDKQKLLSEISSMSSIAYQNNPSIEDLKKLDDKLKEYRKKYGLTDNFMIETANKVKQRLEEAGEKGETAIDQATNREEERNEYEKNHPSTGVLGNPNNTSTIHSPDEIIKEANEFLSSGNGTVPINGQNLQEASSTLYNILLSIGIFSSIAIGIYLGVKFMASSAEDKAKVKEALIPYVAGCVVIFGAFIIWKLVIGLVSSIS